MFPALRPESHHLLHLDLLRFVAAAGVIFLHARTLVVGVPGWADVLIATDAFRLFVDLFFTISGFVIAYVYAAHMASADDYGRFLLKRIARLGPLHWVTLAAFVAIGVAVHAGVVKSSEPEIYDWSCLVPNALLLHATGLCPHLSFNAPSWSIGAEACLYVLSPAVFWLMRRRGALKAVFAVVLAALCLGGLGGREWSERTSDLGLLRALPSFLAGVLMFRHRAALARLPRPDILVWVLLGLFVISGIVRAPSALSVVILYGVAASALGADEQRRFSPVVRVGAALGSLTYSSYMLHGLVMMALVSLLADRVLHLGPFGRDAMVVLAVLAVWPVSWLSFTFFETPARKWIGSLGRRANAGPSGASTSRLSM